MRKLIIDPEFRDKIPPLSEEEFQTLKENILADGEVREPIVVWNDTIVDGHHRWKILQEHPELPPPKIKEMEFADKWAAIAWMCKNQLGRRNLKTEQIIYLRGKQYEAEKMSVKNVSGLNQYSEVKGQNAPKPKKNDTHETSRRIAKEHGVNESTIRRDAKVAKFVDEAETISPGFRDRYLSGGVKASKKDIIKASILPTEEKREIVEKIISGEFSPQKNHPPKPYKSGGTKEYRDLRKSIDEIAADMYNAESDTVYGVDELVDDIRVNADMYIQQLRRILEIHSTLLTDVNKPIVRNEIESHILVDIKNIMEELLK